MIIGVSSVEYTRWGDEMYNKMREHGFLAVDYDLSNTEVAPFNLSDSEAEAYLLEEKSKISDAGLIISQVHGPWNGAKNDGSVEGRAERMEKMKRSLRFSSILGCKYWVIHPIIPHTDQDKKYPEKVQNTWDINIEFMSELLKTAKEYDVVICFENMPMPNFCLGSPQDILRFVEEINDENFKICFDTGHATMFKSKSVGDHVRELGKYIKTFHIHDNNGWADLHMLPFFGVIDWEDFGKSLKDIDFKGVFSFESQIYPKLNNEEYETLCKMKYKMVDRIINT